MYGISQEDEASEVVFRRAARTPQSWPWSFETKIEKMNKISRLRNLCRKILKSEAHKTKALTSPSDNAVRELALELAFAL